MEDRKTRIQIVVGASLLLVLCLAVGGGIYWATSSRVKPEPPATPTMIVALATPTTTPTATPTSRPTSTPTAMPTPEPETVTMYVTAAVLNIRPMAGTTQDPVGTLECGDEVTVYKTSADGDWAQIHATLKRWVSTAYLAETEPDCGAVAANVAEVQQWAKVELPEPVWSNASALLVCGPALTYFEGERWNETSPGNWELDELISFTVEAQDGEYVYVNLQVSQNKEKIPDYYNDVVKEVGVDPPAGECEWAVVLFENDTPDTIRTGWSYEITREGETTFRQLTANQYDELFRQAREYLLP